MHQDLDCLIALKVLIIITIIQMPTTKLFSFNIKLSKIAKNKNNFSEGNKLWFRIPV